MEKDKRMMYRNLATINICPDLRKAGFQVNSDGKVEIPDVVGTENPWLHSNREKDNRSCLFWLHVLFKHFNILPENCLGCWKTFCRVDTLRELYEIYEFQKNESKRVVDIACKCGIERRVFTGNLGGYAAFWYNPLGCSINEARRNTELLSNALGKELKLKRGCTEMEMWTRNVFGKPSEKWEEVITEVMKIKEAQLTEIFVFNDVRNFDKPNWQIVDTLQSWIEHAAKYGDQTYKDFCDIDLVVPLSMYRKDNHGLDSSANQEGRVGQTGGKEQPLIETLEEN